MRLATLPQCRKRPLRLGVSTAILTILAATASQTSSANVAPAARDADVDAVRKLIASGADVNAPEADSTTALLWAAYQSSPELVSMLLSAGADPNVANDFGVTPLLQASRYGDAATIAVLLKGK